MRPEMRWHDKGRSISERLLHLCQMPVEFFSVKLIYGFIGFPARRRLARSEEEGVAHSELKRLMEKHGSCSVLAPFSWWMLYRKLSKSQEIYLPENCETT